LIAFVFYGIGILSHELFRNILSIHHITYMRLFYILLYFLGHILRSNILRYYYSIIYLHQLSSFASLDAISKFTPFQIAFACQVEVRDTGVLPCRRSRFVSLQRSSSHNRTTTRGPSYLTQLLITQKINVMNCMVRTGYRLLTSTFSPSPH
jgi:hypothetical protein